MLPTHQCVEKVSSDDSLFHVLTRIILIQITRVLLSSTA